MAALSPWAITFAADGRAIITAEIGRSVERVTLTPEFSAAVAGIGDQLTAGVVAALWDRAVRDPERLIADRAVSSITVH